MGDKTYKEWLQELGMYSLMKGRTKGDHSKLHNTEKVTYERFSYLQLLRHPHGHMNKIQSFSMIYVSPSILQPGGQDPQASQMASGKQSQRWEPHLLNDHLVHLRAAAVRLTTVAKKLVKLGLTHSTLVVFSNGSSGPNFGGE